MSNELAKTSGSAAIAPVVFDPAKVAKYLDVVGLGDKMTDLEKAMFIEVAAANHLNPFKREVYPIVYGEGNNRKVSIVTGYEVYIKRAESTGLMQGWRVWIEGSFQKKQTKEQKPAKGGGTYTKTVTTIEGNMKAVIEINRKDWLKPFQHEVDLEEYWRDTEQWITKPKTMLKKVATGQGFRLCFPNEYGGLPYLEEELGVIEAGEQEPAELADAPKSRTERLAAAMQEPVIEAVIVDAGTPEPEPEQPGCSPELLAILKQIEDAKTSEELEAVISPASALADDGEKDIARRSWTEKADAKGWS